MVFKIIKDIIGIMLLEISLKLMDDNNPIKKIIVKYLLENKETIIGILEDRQ